LAVTDVARSVAFYTDVLGFEIAVDAPPPADDDNYGVIVDSLQGGVILTHGDMFFGLRPVADANVSSGDRFDPFRVGLDHLSFAVPSRADLDAAVELLDERGVAHGPIRDLAPFGLSLLAFFDPDGIALELTGPLSDSP
jgi:catechol 2,3-dioxygenase-like lactoylglutathione lyase family enzyme